MFSTASEVCALAGQCRALLLDLNDTFAFDCDRLGSDQHFEVTYRELGGAGLDPTLVRRIVHDTCQSLRSTGHDPASFTTFPTVRDTVAGLNQASPLASNEIDMLADVIGTHEVGTVPPEYAAAVRTLAGRYRLGLVSNIWSSSRFFTECLTAAGVEDCFETLVFSSDHGITKPSAEIFEIAMAAMGVRSDETLYVGNSFRRDVVGARNAGLRVVWINARGEESGPGYSPDAVMSDFLEFVSAVA